MVVFYLIGIEHKLDKNKRNDELEEMEAKDIVAICHKKESVYKMFDIIDELLYNTKCQICNQYECAPYYFPMEDDTQSQITNLTSYMSELLNVQLKKIQANKIYWTGLPEKKFKYSFKCKNCYQSVYVEDNFATERLLLKYWCNRRKVTHCCPFCKHIISPLEFLKTSH